MSLTKGNKNGRDNETTVQNMCLLPSITSIIYREYKRMGPGQLPSEFHGDMPDSVHISYIHAKLKLDFQATEAEEFKKIILHAIRELLTVTDRNDYF